MRSLAVTGIKDFSLSDDGSEATFALVTKYAGDFAVTLPASSLKALQVPAKRDKAGAKGTREKAVDGKAAAHKTSGDFTVSVPKKWFIAADSQRGLVVVGLDPQTPAQSGFALRPKAAKELAAALVKQADAVAAGTPAKRA
jgi:hypothetical protein